MAESASSRDACGPVGTPTRSEALSGMTVKAPSAALVISPRSRMDGEAFTRQKPLPCGKTVAYMLSPSSAKEVLSFTRG